jgi:hypothetical protein
MKEFAPYYFTVYMMVVMLMTFYKFSVTKSLRGYTVLYQRDNYWPMIVFTVFFILVFGFRPISVIFGDTVNYNNDYQTMYTTGSLDASGISETDSDWLFYGIMFMCSQIIDVYYFFSIVV